MTVRRIPRHALLAVTLAWIGLGSAPDAAGQEPLLDGLGPYSRPVTTSSEAAQRYFDQGLNLLFAFNHEEAARSFRQAAELDPSCVMAWWGLAYAQGPHINLPVVSEEQARVALDAIEHARSAAGEATGLERALVEALALRHVPEPPEDRSGLDRAYADAMREIRAGHPDDPDVGCFYAESLMNLRPWALYTQEGLPEPGTEEIVALIEAILGSSPDHPLANHLYIHAVEPSARPDRAEAAADRLRDLQPGLSHNVHMPSHIDVRLGHWEQAEESNRKAIEADRRFLAIRPDPGFYGLYIAHNYHMLAYAAMMRGRSGAAIDAIDEMMALIPERWARENAAIADGYLAMPLEVRMRFGLWEEILDAPEPDPAFPLARALRRYARAVSLAAQGRVEEAKAEQGAFLEARALVPESARFGNNAASDLLDVAEHLMRGEILYREGREDDAFDALREAVRLQDLLRYSEPPDWIQPVRHALAAALNQSGRFDEAERVCREDLEQLPENGWALFGLMQALERQGKDEEAKQVRARWEEIWKDADVTLSSCCFCQPGV
ncbi:tetratricopeptide repeat protein [Tautonia plasticadhaerens]|uniref:Tetratricopeptide repeat protein n=1 Tax=Tautonia plasticadhaerens TaxID=2527974 RepID=A0A518H2I5_9BACT|nr:tetratricopeptide repeat protein [Tautonia plasticadhaerens]QDV35072.1 Tetratricopeptide repeat protein [Tautonia plasticadhaerens]